MGKTDILREIIDRATITADDRFFIKTLSAELGVEFTPRARCRDCYRDQAAVLYKKLKDANPSPDGRRWRMRADVDIIYKERRVNDTLLTDELAEEMLAIGLPRHWFYENKQ